MDDKRLKTVAYFAVKISDIIDFSEKDENWNGLLSSDEKNRACLNMTFLW